MTTTAVLRKAAPLREQVVAALRTEIIEGEMAPGERLFERTLCDRYGVSRTVIREVLRQLESESLVTMRPGHGPEVTRLTPADIKALYEVRAELEGLAAELFARRASDVQVAEMCQLAENLSAQYLNGTLESRGIIKSEFYRLLLEGAGNPVLASSLAQIHARIGIFRHFSFVDPKRVEVSYEEIQAIITAMAQRRDPEAARSASAHHITFAGELAVFEYTKRFSHEKNDGGFDALRSGIH